MPGPDPVRGARVAHNKRRRVVNEPKSRLSRRNFLVTLGAGSVAAAATVVATRAPEGAQAPAQAAGKRDTQGYHVTAHVNNYYRSAKV